MWATSAAPDALTAAAADPACRQETRRPTLPDQSARNALACAMSELQQSIHTDDLPRMARTLALSRLTGHRSDLSAARRSVSAHAVCPAAPLRVAPPG